MLRGGSDGRKPDEKAMKDINTALERESISVLVHQSLRRLNCRRTHRNKHNPYPSTPSHPIPKPPYSPYTSLVDDSAPPFCPCTSPPSLKTWFSLSSFLLSFCALSLSTASLTSAWFEGSARTGFSEGKRRSLYCTQSKYQPIYQ